MNVTAIVGGQYGDEGKGKFVHYLVHKNRVDIVGRGNGGPNAGHNVYDPARNIEIALHLMPSGVFADFAVNIVGCGTVINPHLFVEELQTVIAAGAKLTPDNLKLSSRAHMILQSHRALDSAKDLVGSTGQGIGPAYRDKATRLGLRLESLLRPNFLDIAKERLEAMNAELSAMGADQSMIDIPAELALLKKSTDILKPYICDTVSYLNDARAKNKTILLEGAQATMLDINFGTYPYVTSSSAISGGIALGLGIPANAVTRVVGIFKLPMTRVGKGPFVTKLTETEDALCDQLAGVKGQAGAEFGATTGRARDIGWMDAVMVKYANQVNGFTDIALTKLDMLSGIPTLKVATSYMLDGQEITYMPADVMDIEKCTPVYTELPGWDENVAGATSFEALPKNAQNYIKFIEDYAGVPVTMIGTGPNNDDIICRTDK